MNMQEERLFHGSRKISHMRSVKHNSLPKLPTEQPYQQATGHMHCHPTAFYTSSTPFNLELPCIKSGKSGEKIKRVDEHYLIKEVLALSSTPQNKETEDKLPTRPPSSTCSLSSRATELLNRYDWPF